jgi:hypothetical protein
MNRTDSSRLVSHIPQYVSLFRDLVAHRGRDAAIEWLKAVDHLTEEDVATVIREAEGAPVDP